MINYDSWKPWYEKIRKVFGYDIQKDIEASIILDSILREFDVRTALNRLKNLIKNKNVIVFGAGPNLENHLKNLANFIEEAATNISLIAADGATSAVLKLDLKPDIITTDLDGRISDIVKANKFGSLIVVHAHGDNIDKIKRYVRAFKKNSVVGTCQTKPYGVIRNFGGFTDGDRAVFLSLHFNANKILLAGWSFSGLVGKYSKPEFNKHTIASEVKRKKLEIAKTLISWIAKENQNKIYVFNEEIPNALTIKSLEEVKRIFG